MTLTFDIQSQIRGETTGKALELPAELRFFFTGNFGLQRVPRRFTLNFDVKSYLDTFDFDFDDFDVNRQNQVQKPSSAAAALSHRAGSTGGGGVRGARAAGSCIGTRIGGSP